MSTWPSTLPTLPGQFNHGMIDTTEEFKTDCGLVRVAAHYTRAPETLSFSLYLTGTQKLTLMAFEQDTLENRTLSFEWIAPDGAAGSEETRNWYIAGPIQYTCTRGGATDADRRYNAKVNLVEDLYA